MSTDSGSSYLLLLAIYLVAVGVLFQLMRDRNSPFLVGLSVRARLSGDPRATHERV